MAFNGIIPAAPLEVRPCGLFSVARVVEHREEEEHWLNGSFIETDAYPTVQIRTQQDAAVPAGAGVIYDGTGKPATYATTPFFVELKASKTTLDFLRDGVTPELEKQAKAVAQKAVERELWEGVATQNANPVSAAAYLRRATNNGGATVVTTAGVTPEKALFLIEQAIASQSPTGGPGIIHMTPDVASALGSRLRYFEKNNIDENTYAITRIGTLVVIGAGYTGAGPIGATGTAASPTNKWMFATGGVTVELGRPAIQEYNDLSTNDHFALVSLSAAVHFDPSIFSAAQVTLP